MQLYDTLSGRKERFVVAKGNHVRMLLCGPTVYDYSHIGHARMLFFYDLMARYFRSRKISVSVIVNITDIDQKVFSKARTTVTRPAELASKFIEELLHDLSSLGINGFMLARVSDHVAAARQLIAELLQSGKAYSAGGNVYLDTTTPSLGMMAKMTRKDLDNCRLDISPAKKSPSDILLWNASESFDVSPRQRSWQRDTVVAYAGFFCGDVQLRRLVRCTRRGKRARVPASRITPCPAKGADVAE